MYWDILNLFSTPQVRELLLDGHWGLEKESQRVTPSGDLALSDHPEVFGDKLGNPEITTDFAESQLELITPPFRSIEETYEYLVKLQSRVEQEINGELLWPLSMPPRLPEDEVIPIARFGNTPEGREMEIYRYGLALRYGKKMQMISGLHYNFSFGDQLLGFLHRQSDYIKDRGTFANDLYLHVTRNYLRFRWLLIYLFGASPSIDPTFYPTMQRELEVISKCCPECCNEIDKYEQYATSLRVSRFGYSNTDHGRNGVPFNTLADYTTNILRLLKTKSGKFRELGIYQNGRQVQLNDYILQKESEFYSPIRLKQTLRRGETQLDALQERGIKYLEIRILDLNPFEKVSINLEQLYFLQIFMLFCLFEESPYFSNLELEQADKNHHLTALSGRKPRLSLYKYNNGTILLRDWGIEIFEKLKTIALLVDAGTNSSKYETCVGKEYKKLMDPSLLPSSLIYKDMKQRNESYLDFGIRRAIINRYKDITELNN